MYFNYVCTFFASDSLILRTHYVSNIMIPYQSFVISLISNLRYDVKIKKKRKQTKIRKDYYSIYCCDLWLNTNPILFIPNNYKCSKYTFRWSMTIVIYTFFLFSFSQKKTQKNTLESCHRWYGLCSRGIYPGMCQRGGGPEGHMPSQIWHMPELPCFQRGFLNAPIIV